jgi:hypothetical protein
MARAWSLTVAVSVGLVFLVHAQVRAQQTPGTPTNVIAVADSSNLSVSWNAPTTGAAPTGYRLDFRSGSTLVASVSVGTATATTIAIPPGTTGTFSVTVTAIAGSAAGSPSAPATFTISSGCPIPVAPTGLTGNIVSGNATVQWNGVLNASNYIVQAGSAQFSANLFNGSVGNNTTVTASGLPPGFQAYVRVFANNACGTSAPTPDFLLTSTTTPPPSGCTPSPTRVCAFDRFQIDVTFRDSAGRSGPATVAPNGRYFDGGEFWFVNPNNVDLLVQVLNRCSNNNRYWVFASGNTNVEVTINVTDTLRGGTKQYVNPLNTPFAPVSDTSAFATCP